ncbi:sensor histidine kinase [Nocardioides sp. NPDC092400]|uniref:sensor histidine kinase n=1 Tax=Nocardioides sp. NPDC092400 TaxID=3155196 RepID=UPI0034208F38
MRLLRTPVLVDVSVAFMLSCLSLVAALGSSEVGPAGAVLAVLSVAPLAARQVAPTATLTVITLALGGYALLGHEDTPSAAIGLVIALFTVATVRPRATVAVLFLMPLAVLAVTYLRVDGVTWALVGQAVVLLLCAWALGDSTRRWAVLAQDAAARAERSVSDERTRIARELHDVVAHHMSVVALQTGVARFVVDTDVPAARAALVDANDATREALADMRRMLEALRTDEDGAGFAPQPGLADLDQLADRLGPAGLTVTVTRTGEPRPIGAGRELCVYRTAQEALTNVLRHAGTHRAEVTLDLGPRVLSLTVADDGRGASAGARDGFGLTGMRERAELFGGVLDAGPRPGGGFAVCLRLPLAAAPVTGEPARRAAPVSTGRAS